MVHSRPVSAATGCIKQQLREVVLGFHRLHPATPSSSRRSFSIAARTRQETATVILPDELAQKRDKTYGLRHIHPNGRVIGKAGRRQRQLSEPLAIKALGRPSEVIIIRDVNDDTDAANVQAGPMSSTVKGGRPGDEVPDSDAFREFMAQDATSPDQAEVDASIDQLRPNVTILDGQEFENLKKKLIDGYNAQQLTRYLLGSTTQVEAPLTTTSPERNSIRISDWRPGRTPLNQRVATVLSKKSEIGKNKSALAEQILRSIWTISIQSEERQVGELEMYVQSWQVQVLFDLRDSRNTPRYQTLIGSPILLRSSDVRPYRPDNVIRVTARKGDAVDIARLLQTGLARVRTERMNLSVFAPLLGSDGWPNRLQDLFEHSDLEDIGKRTESIVEVKGDEVVIHTFASSAGAAHARRLLLSLLKLPSPSETLTTILGRHQHTIEQRDIATTQDKMLRTFGGLRGTLKVNEQIVGYLPRRYCGRRLFRLERPNDGALLAFNAKRRDPAVHKIGQVLQEHRAATCHSNQDHSLPGNAEAMDWRRIDGAADWTARLGLHVHATSTSHRHDGEVATRPDANEPLFLPHAVELQTIVSHFEPVQLDAQDGSCLRRAPGSGRAYTSTSLRMHFRPSPFSHDLRALEKLPRLKLELNVNAPRRDAPEALALQEVQLTIGEQTLDIPCPEHPYDLQFRSHSALRLATEDARSQRIGGYLQHLRTSFHQRKGLLETSPELKLKVPPPPRCEGEEGGEGEEVEVTYLFDHFEHRHSTTFRPITDAARIQQMHPVAAAMVREWPADIQLVVQDMDAGSFGGRRTELILTRRAVDPPDEPDLQESSDPSPERAGRGKEESFEMRLARTAFSFIGVAQLASCGKLTSPYERARANVGHAA